MGNNNHLIENFRKNMKPIKLRHSPVMMLIQVNCANCNQAYTPDKQVLCVSLLDLEVAGTMVHDNLARTNMIICSDPKLSIHFGNVFVDNRILEAKAGEEKPELKGN